MTPSPLPLSGIRVLDFTRVLAGPFCTMLLADFGADVIKVEEPARGDDTRHWGPPWAGEGDDALSAYYLCANRNKRSMTLNLKTEQGQSIARALAERSHIVVENLKPGGMAAFGLGYDDLAVLNPALIYCSITGFGQRGPYSDQPGYDFVIQAMSGLMSITGPAEGEPYKVGVAVTDVFAGLFALSSILAALRYAEHSGQGQHLDVALLDTSIAALVNVASNALISGLPPARYGNAHANIVPYQTFQASDNMFAVAVGNDRQFSLLCHAIGQPELARDARYVTNPARVQHRDSLIPVLQAVFSQRSASEWVERLLALGIPSGTLNDIPTILNDPHVQTRELIQDVQLTNGVTAAMVGMPVGFSATPMAVRLPPPGHGAHTDEILRTVLAMDDTDIAALRADGVV